MALILFTKTIDESHVTTFLINFDSIYMLVAMHMLLCNMQYILNAVEIHAIIFILHLWTRNLLLSYTPIDAMDM